MSAALTAENILDEVYYCQTKRVGDKYKFLLSQFVQWCSLVCSVRNAFNVKSRGYTALKEHLKDVDVSQTCVSSEKKLILARIGLFGDTKAAITRYTSNIVHNLVWDLDLRILKCQYPPYKNRRLKVEREVNLQMAEEIKAGGESSWWRVFLVARWQ